MKWYALLAALAAAVLSIDSAGAGPAEINAAGMEVRWTPRLQQDPIRDPGAVEDRIDAGSPDEAVVDEERRTRLIPVALVIIALVFVGFAWWAFASRRRRQHRYDSPQDSSR